jgi:diguanylate cyclase
MGYLLVDILFVAIGATVGAIAGWLLRGSPPEQDVAPHAAPEPDPTKGVAQVESLMSRLHQLTASVAADIGEHSNRVQEINCQLVGGADVVTIVERLVQANERMQVQLQAAEKRLQSQAREIESHVKEARTDALTRLANRRAFDDEIRRHFEDYRRSGTSFCLMLVDVDHFKKFNDTYGHQVGDEVLKGVAWVLRREFTEHELVCRYGGEEFAVIFPGNDLDAVIRRAEQGRQAIGQEVIEYQEMDLRVAASGGIAEIQPNESVEQLVKRADDALYVSKSSGRNCGYWHDGTNSRPIHDYVPGQGRRQREQSLDAARNAEKSVFQLGPNKEERRVDRAERFAGLSDHDTLVADLARRLKEQQRLGTSVALMCLRIDRLSQLVEQYGEKAAELAQRAAAQIIHATKRDMDHAARMADDVFGVLLPGAELYEASSAAERIRTAIEGCKVPVDGEHLEITVSLGITDTRNGDDGQAFLSRALEAMEAASRCGGNCVRTAPSAPALPDLTRNSTEPVWTAGFDVPAAGP